MILVRGYFFAMNVQDSDLQKFENMYAALKRAKLEFSFFEACAMKDIFEWVPVFHAKLKEQIETQKALVTQVKVEPPIKSITPNVTKKKK